jgi:hypothetical protein
MDWNGLLDGMTDIVRDTFSQPIIFTPGDTGIPISTKPDGTPLTAILDYDAADSKEGSATITNRLTIIDVKLADIGGITPKKRDAVQFVDTGEEFEVNQRIPSSSGMMKLELRKRG